MDAQITFRSEQRLTQEEFWDWIQSRAADDIHHYELIHGRIVMTPPADFRHGTLDAWLAHLLWEHVDQHELGVVQGSSTTYALPSGDTLEPDVSFVSKQRLAAGPEPQPGRFAKLVPDLVLEILSHSTARRDRTAKRDIYAANGVREYWLVDPKRREVTVFALHDGAYGEATPLATGVVPSEVLPKLGLTVAEIFRP